MRETPLPPGSLDPFFWFFPCLRMTSLIREKWCPERESNPHAPLQEARDFKSLVSTSFTIRAAKGAIVPEAACNQDAARLSNGLA